jgi:hypothetical protein
MTRLAMKAGRYLQRGFVTGLADIVSVVGPTRHRPFPGTYKTAAEALGGDWERLGGDMRKAVDQVKTARGAR